MAPNTVEPKTVLIEWRWQSKNKKNAEFVKSSGPIYDNCLPRIPKKVKLKLHYDDSGPFVRDLIRVAFKLHKFYGQVESLGLTVKKGDNEHNLLNELFPAMTAPWDPIRNAIWNDDSISEVRFILLVRDAVVGDESIFETIPFRPGFEARLKGLTAAAKERIVEVSTAMSE